VSNNVSMPDPAQQVAEVRRIIEQRGQHSCESTLLSIRRVIDPPPPAQPIERESTGWPRLQPSDWQDTGTGTGYTGRVIPPVEGLHDSGDDQEADR
jgi:hypothetical protein